METERVKITSDWSIARLHTIFHTHQHSHVFRAHIQSIFPPGRNSQDPLHMCAQNFRVGMLLSRTASHRFVFA